MSWVRPIAEELWLLREHRDGYVITQIDGHRLRVSYPKAEYHLPEERH